MSHAAEVAALFVQADGVYSRMPDVDPWPEARDARTYAGPLPVVAHPPCQRWGKLGAANFCRWGGEHNRPGNDSGCFFSALMSVNTYGGVLEHPAGSHAFSTFCLARPEPRRWTKSGKGYTCEVWQSAYGHPANKATWLYFRSRFDDCPPSATQLQPPARGLSSGLPGQARPVRQ